MSTLQLQNHAGGLGWFVLFSLSVRPAENDVQSCDGCLSLEDIEESEIWNVLELRDGNLPFLATEVEIFCINICWYG